MKRLITAAAVGALALTVLAAPTAQADHRCLFNGDWNCYGTPPYSGPLLPTWDTPGTYGGWTTNPIQCDPYTDRCYQVVTP